MSRHLVMTRSERAALADAIRDMRREGVRPAHLVQLKAAPRSPVAHVNLPRNRLRVRT